MVGTIVDVELPAENFALEQTLDRLETVVFEVKQMVAYNYDSLLPFIWVGTDNRDAIERAFAEDETVAGFQLVGEFDTDCLYRLEWVEEIDVLVRVLVEENGTILSATGSDGSWQLRFLFADHDSVTRTHQYCEENGIPLEIQNITEFAGEDKDRYGLSKEQRTTLRLAYDRGYYSIPRETKAEALAEEVGVTHQAISERLRRGHGTLLQNTLVNGHGTTASPQPKSEDADEEVAPGS
ncbi:helix-turn-helix domain-containing protein [Haladaptatus pallidirubidus]|uniref:GAF and HTH_10 associated domain-containing protein n=1 Tax=Haladaptatus pallidirubidus TaxID=1008152 RepID=A0AAV3UDL3_9EURY|nr:helix-turn-helix domain-containing protein [Haladaptatus pallidirubidus]